jgi:hypothetical protein
MHCCGCGCLCVCVKAVRRRCDVWRVRLIDVATLAVWCVGEQHTQHAGVSDVAVDGLMATGTVLGASECMTHILDSLDQLIHVSDRGSELVPAMPCHGDGNLCVLGASD